MEAVRRLHWRATVEYDVLKLKLWTCEKSIKAIATDISFGWLGRYKSLHLSNCFNDGKRLKFELVTMCWKWASRPPRIWRFENKTVILGKKKKIKAIKISLFNCLNDIKRLKFELFTTFPPACQVSPEVRGVRHGDLGPLRAGDFCGWTDGHLAAVASDRVASSST